MDFVYWFVSIGLLLMFMAVAGTTLRRLPLTVAMVYLAFGYLLGPAGLGLHRLDPVGQSRLLEHLSEIIVIISLFTAGLKLRLPLSHHGWRLPLRLAFIAMAVTVGLITLVGVYGLGLPLGAAVLLGAVLAPTDPVLASDVQVENDRDQEELRFGLTGEAGLNDGTAFPFLMLALGLLHLHDLGTWGWKWIAVDVVWAILGGLAIGWLCGIGIARLVLYLRREHKEALGTDDFLTLGLIALAYGLALVAHTYGFLAVFAAGLAVRHTERKASGAGRAPAGADIKEAAADDQDAETDRREGPAYMADAVLGFNEQLERIGQVGVVLLIGGMLYPGYLAKEALWFVPVLFLIIRPLSVWISVLGSGITRLRRDYMSWFGIRGIGSVYYLSYAVEQGVGPDMAQRLVGITFTVVAVSIVLHGISVTPLMERYRRLGGAK